jgi:hypothetical protein
LLAFSSAAHTPTPQVIKFVSNSTILAGITPATGTFINAIIADDPDTLFKMAVVSGTTVVTGIQYTGIGQNSTLVQNTGVHSYWKLGSGLVGCYRYD